MFRMAADSEDLHTAAVWRKLLSARGGYEKLLLTPLGGNLFRLENSSLLTGAFYRDVIRATETECDALLFVEITERSSLVTSLWVLSPELIQSDAVQAILKQVKDVGGHWEHVLRGWLFVHTPPMSAKEIDEQIRPISALHRHVVNEAHAAWLGQRRSESPQTGRGGPGVPTRLMRRR